MFKVTLIYRVIMYVAMLKTTNNNLLRPSLFSLFCLKKYIFLY